MGSYTHNVADESRRLAYFTMTRACFGVMWVPLVGGSRVAEVEGQKPGIEHSQFNPTISGEVPQRSSAGLLQSRSPVGHFLAPKQDCYCRVVVTI